MSKIKSVKKQRMKTILVFLPLVCVLQAKAQSDDGDDDEHDRCCKKMRALKEDFPRVVLEDVVQSISLRRDTVVKSAQHHQADDELWERFSPETFFQTPHELRRRILIEIRVVKKLRELRNEVLQEQLNARKHNSKDSICERRLDTDSGLDKHARISDSALLVPKRKVKKADHALYRRARWSVRRQREQS